jgi:hypothetical protein
MNRRRRIIVSLLLVLIISTNICTGVFAANESSLTREELYKAAQKTIEYYHKTYKSEKYEGIMDWPALGLFGFGEDVSGPKWTVDGKNAAYFREEEAKNGVGLSKTKNTDFQRTIIGICAAGKDPRNFAGMNLVQIVKDTMLPNGHFADSVADNKTGKPVGDNLINAHIFGVIALHCAGEPIPNRDKCVEWLEKQQHKDGGFTWDVKYFDNPKDYDYIVSDVDMTAAALMAFAILGEDESNSVVAKAIQFLHDEQLPNGGFHSWGTDNPESCAWAIQALTLLGQDPMGPEWTNTKGQNPVTSLLRFQNSDGSFVHVLEEDDMIDVYENSMSTYEALYGMADAYNKKSAYDMLYEKYRPEGEKYLFKYYKPGDYAFKETADLVYDYIISGYTDGTFKPDNNVTRAEFTKMLNNGKGFRNEARDYSGESKFNDVPEDHWAYGNIGVSAEKGYITGVTEDTFKPEDPITGEQLMIILIRAAGLEEEADKLKTGGGDWVEGYINLAKEKGLVYENFQPKEPVTRAQCAWSLYQFLNINN